MRVLEGKNPLILDSKDPTLPLEKYVYNEARYRILLQSDEPRTEALMQQAKSDVRERFAQLSTTCESTSVCWNVSGGEPCLI